MKLALASLLFFATTLAGCERVEVSTTNTTSKPAQGTEALAASPTLIDRIESSRNTTPFQGVRHVEVHFLEGSVQRHTVMRERVSADGHGAYAIEALDLLEPQVSESDRALFLTLQSVQQGMHWRYRDFAIRNVSLFLQNYRMTDTGLSETVAGRPCMVFEVGRIDASGSLYTIFVDEPTGLVLRSRETSVEGALISEMSYESIELQADLSGVAWHQSVNNEKPVPLQGGLKRYVGFEVRSPLSLPAGYSLLDRTSLLHPLDGTWVKTTYGDGIESVFFLHGGPIVAGNGIRSGVPEIQADLVEVTSIPPWTVARGNLRSERVIVLGKASEHELLLMLRSAME